VSTRSGYSEYSLTDHPSGGADQVHATDDGKLSALHVAVLMNRPKCIAALMRYSEYSRWGYSESSQWGYSEYSQWGYSEYSQWGYSEYSQWGYSEYSQWGYSECSQWGAHETGADAARSALSV
jgi:hypothetical protein